MFETAEPRWLRWAERKFRWIGVPNLATILIGFQIFGFIFVYLNPEWYERLALVPARAARGEPWRVITFLALPLSLSPLWLLFALWFLYFVVDLIENEWGETKTTLYVLVSLLLTILFSLVTGAPVTQIRDFTSTLFLAAATLFPELEVRLFFAIPVKLRWLGWFTGIFILVRLFEADWIDRAYLAVIYSNYILFFGPSVFQRLKHWKRRQDFRRKLWR